MNAMVNRMGRPARRHYGPTIRRAAWLWAAIFLSSAAAGEVCAQADLVTFRSASVVGVSREAQASGAPLTPEAHYDISMRLWSADARHYLLDAFGCQYDVQPLPLAGDEVEQANQALLAKQVALYRGGVSQALGQGGRISSVLTGRLYRVPQGAEAADEDYGFGCSDTLYTGVALDVVRQPGFAPKLRIFMAQFTPASAQKDASGLRLAVGIMDNVLFSPREPEALSRAGPLTADLYHALTQ